jgi:hypothetical protein
VPAPKWFVDQFGSGDLGGLISDPHFSLEGWARAGLIASTVANANRDQKRRRRPYEPQDFIPNKYFQKYNI